MTSADLMMSSTQAELARYLAVLDSTRGGVSLCSTLRRDSTVKHTRQIYVLMKAIGLVPLLGGEARTVAQYAINVKTSNGYVGDHV